VFEPLQRGVDRAGGRRVAAVHPLLELLHDLIAVPRLVAKQLEDHVLHVAGLEPLPPAASMSPSPEAEQLGAELELEPFPPFVPMHRHSLLVITSRYITTILRHDISLDISCQFYRK